MNAVTLAVVMFLLVLVLGMQIQISDINKKLDEFLKRTGRL
jgi:hypothetical protein